MNNKFFFDSGAGINYVIGNFMIGASGQHLNEPNETLTGVASPLPMRWNGYACWLISTNPDLEESPAVIPSVVVATQAGVKSVSLGLQLKKRNLNLGLWFRSGGAQSSSVVLSLIFDIFTNTTDDKYRFGISHDLATSGLAKCQYRRQHRRGITYETNFQNYLDNQRRENNQNRTCYDFY